MERIERKKNPKIKKAVRWFLLLIGIMVVVYGYTRIPYFVVKRNLMLQYEFTYENYDEVIEKREIYLSEEYYSILTTSASVIDKREALKQKKVTCRILSLELGQRELDDGIPYTIVYELTYGDGVTPAQRVALEGVQILERCGGVWWKVKVDNVKHSGVISEGEHSGHTHTHE